MSAQEVIEQINALPPEEREEVVNYVREQPTSPAAAAPAEQARPNWRVIMNKIFDEHDELFRKLAQ
jgi:hypothetical protein